MLMTTSSLSRFMKPGVDKVVGVNYKEYDQEYREIFDVQSSDQNYEEQVLMNGLGLLKVKPEGDSITYDSMSQGAKKLYRPVVFSTGFIVTEEEQEDNKYPEVTAYFGRELGKAARVTKEHVHANVLNRAFSSSYLGIDGVALASASHKLGKGGTYSNLLTAADLSEESLENAVIQARSFVDEAGKKINVMPRKLIVPVNEMFNAERILKSTLQPGTANNDVNALRVKGSLPEGVMVSNFLTDTDVWFILTDCQQGLQSFQRRALRVMNETPDFDTGNIKYKIDERYSLGWTDPRAILCNAGA